jgi:hypothetical protein
MSILKSFQLSGRSFDKCTLKINLRSSSSGRPIKNISSKRPFRINSTGKTSKLFAVDTTNTGAVFSDNHVIKVPKTLLVVPLSPLLFICPNVL